MHVRRAARGSGTWAAMLAGGAAVIVLALMYGTRDAPITTEIGSAVQSVSDDGGAASRSAEEVSYDDADLELVATYVIEGGGPDDDDPASHRAAWDTTVQVLPEWAVAEIRQLNLVTDGENGTLAMVHRSGVANDRWILSIDPVEDAAVLEDTLVHELVHMLTLRRFDVSTTNGACAGVRLQIGCAAARSALADWADEFWDGVDEPAVFDRDSFVTEYAASAAHEDLAETFLVYVTDAEPPDEPLITAKLAFFDEHEELAKVADELRARLGRG